MEATLEAVRRVRLRTLDAVSSSDERSLEFVLHRCLAVYQPYRTKSWRLLFDLSQPGYHLGTIRVRTVTVDDFDVSVQWHVFSKYLEDRLPFDHASSQRMLCLKSNHEDRIARIARALSKVM